MNCMTYEYDDQTLVGTQVRNSKVLNQMIEIHQMALKSEWWYNVLLSYKLHNYSSGNHCI